MLCSNDEEMIFEAYSTTFRVFSPLQLKAIVSPSFSVIVTYVSVDYMVATLKHKNTHSYTFTVMFA